MPPGVGDGAGSRLGNGVGNTVTRSRRVSGGGRIALNTACNSMEMLID